MMLWDVSHLLFLADLVVSQYYRPLTVSNQKISQYSLDWGTNSYGWVSLMNHGSIQQNAASVTCERMTAATIYPTATLSQDPGSAIQLGNFSELILDEACTLTMQSGSRIQFQQTDSFNGKSHIYCKNASWTFGAKSSIFLQSLTNLYLHAPTFSIESDVTIVMATSSSLEILDDLVIKDLVHLTLNPRSRFFINPGSGNVATITSSDDSTLTTVQLEESAVLIANGTLTIGDGTATSFVLQPNAAVTVSYSGQLVVQSANFIVGQNSFWQIDGVFKVTKSGHFLSGVQSDLKINGTMLTDGGTLTIGDFALMNIQGSCLNHGAISLGNGGQVTAFRGSQLTVNSGGTLTNEGLASVFVSGSFLINTGGIVTLQLYSTLNSTGTFEQDVGTLAIGSYSSFNNQGYTTLQGMTTVSDYSSVQIGRNGRFQSQAASVNIGSRAVLQLTGRVELFNGSFLGLGDNSKLFVQAGTTIVLPSGSSLSLSNNTNLVFSAGMFCTVNGAHNVNSCTTIIVNSNSVGFTCFSNLK